MTGLLGVDRRAPEAGRRRALRLLRLNTGGAQKTTGVRRLVFGTAGDVRDRLVAARGLDHANKKVSAAIHDRLFRLRQCGAGGCDSAQSSAYIARALRHASKSARHPCLIARISSSHHTGAPTFWTSYDEMWLFHNFDAISLNARERDDDNHR